MTFPTVEDWTMDELQELFECLPWHYQEMLEECTNLEQYIRVCDKILSVDEEERNKALLHRAATKLPGVDQKILCPLFDPAKVDTLEAHNLGCKGGQTDLMRVIIHLNDHHHWSREKIADWLDERAGAGDINIDFEEHLFANGDEK